VDPTALGPPLDVRPLLAPERSALLELLGDLPDDDWSRPTPCPRWSVHELVLHLVHDDLRRLSFQRDGHAGAVIRPASSLDELAAALDEANEAWVTASAPTVSPELACGLVAWLAEPSERHLAGLPPDEAESTVAWAGPGSHPNWLDVAREYTERWVHHQQLRQTVDRPGLAGPRFLAPVLETFARGLPAQLPAAPEGTVSELRVVGAVRRAWTVAVRDGSWRFTGSGSRPDAFLELSAEALWRRAVRMAGRHETSADAVSSGPEPLVEALLDLRGAIVGAATR
jgi:uncharacterized protein (TIGR03083 family)